jgi:hypothetical protein
MLRKANNVFSVILSDVSQLTASLPAVGTKVTDANLGVGAIVVTDLGLNRLDAAAFAALPSTGQFFIVEGKGVGNPLMKSPILTKGKISMTLSRHKAAVQQVTVIGYNGTTGALPVSNNSDFFIKIRKRDNDAANRSQPMSLFAGPVKTDATATQAELASLLAKNGTKNFADEPANGYLRFEVISGAADAAITGTVTTFGVTYSSKVVTLNGTVTNVAAGDFIKLGGTTTTTAIYKVAAVNSPNTITLDSAYQGDTASIAVANVRRITAAVAATADFGVRLRGVAAPFDVNAFRDYYANRFTPTFSDSTTLVTHVQGAQNGNGVFQQVAMDEYMSYGFEGQNNQLAVPSIPRDSIVKIPGVAGNTALTSKYSSINIAWEESISGLVSVDGGKGNVLIYTNLANNAGLGSLSSTANTGREVLTTLGFTPNTLLDEL